MPGRQRAALHIELAAVDGPSGASSPRRVRQ
jgi:hypothetical protein